MIWNHTWSLESVLTDVHSPWKISILLFTLVTAAMEDGCSVCSKGIFALATYLADSAVLFQVLKDHNLVPTNRNCPKCETLLNVNDKYFFRCDCQYQVSYSGKKKVSRRCRVKISALKGTFSLLDVYTQVQLNKPVRIVL